MLGDVGWGEILVVLIAAVVIFGPDKLPKLAADLAKGVRLVRGWTQQAKGELDKQLPPELRDFDVGSLHPKTFLRQTILDPSSTDRSVEHVAQATHSGADEPLPEGTSTTLADETVAQEP